jgi:restriction endonuclease S subunit
MGKAVKYIETGIMTCPLLPENWAIKKLKYLAKVQTGRTPSIQGAKVDFFENGEINWFTPADFGNERYLDNSSRKVNQLALDNGEIQLFPNHSIYLVSIGATLGKIGISEKSGSANQQINVISFTEDINPVFGFYFLKSISSNLINEVDFTTLPILNQTKTKDIFIPFPSIETQEIIANFLDQKTAEIDNLISKKQKLIECLKEERMAIINQAVTKGINPNAEMKESGIDWLGDIPKHWEVKRLKYVAEINLGKMLTDKEVKGYFLKPYLRAANILWEKVSIDGIKEMWFSENELKKLRLKQGDLLVSEGGEVGRTAIWEEELNECYVQNSVHKVSIYSTNNSKYFLFYFLVVGYKGLFEAIVNRISIGHLTVEKLKEIVVSVPDFEEQTQIVSYIETKTLEIDNTIKKIEQEIELIKEYRTALINEVVTGKKN